MAQGRATKVVSQGVTYTSMAALAKARGVSLTTVRRAVARGTVDNIRCRGEAAGVAKPVVIDGVEYASQSAAARHLGLTPSAVSKRESRRSQGD